MGDYHAQHIKWAHPFPGLINKNLLATGLYRYTTSLHHYEGGHLDGVVILYDSLPGSQLVTTKTWIHEK